MMAHSRIYILPVVMAAYFTVSANAQLYRSSSYNPYGGNYSNTRSGTYYNGGAGISIAPTVQLGPFGPQLNYFTPLGYVMQPAIVGMPTYFGPSVGVNLNGSRFYGYGFLQGSVDSPLNSQRYQSNSSSGSSSGVSSQYVPNRSTKTEAPKKKYDQFLQEHLQVNPEELKQKLNTANLYHSLTNPSKQEVASGTSMNTVLEALLQMRPQFKEAPQMALDPELLKQLNFTKGSGTGSFGLLRHEGKVPWPQSLLTMAPKDDTAKLRADIEKDFLEAYQQISAGMGVADTLRQLQRNTDQLSTLVSGNIRNMGLNDYMEAKQFLKSVDDTLTFLKQPDAADWLPGKSNIKPKTLQELVHVMSEKQIRFAPALIGNESAYVVMQRMLTDMYKAVAADVAGVKK